jgi:signal transduction histidine kinase
VERVITNLITNAWKYGGERPIQVRVEARGAEAVVSVRDQGQGIPAEKLDLIFRRFERAGDPTAASGLGLGLYIAKQIILAHHGRIEVESRVGEGSCFQVFLPQLR